MKKLLLTIALSTSLLLPSDIIAEIVYNIVSKMTTECYEAKRNQYELAIKLNKEHNTTDEAEAKIDLLKEKVTEVCNGL